MLVAVRQHCQETGALDARRQLTLKERTCASQTSWRYLPSFTDEVTQRVDVFVVDLLDASDREAAKALATEQQLLGITLGFAVL